MNFSGLFFQEKDSKMSGKLSTLLKIQSFDLKISLLLYWILAALLFPFFRYKMYPDVISYISIAQKYLNGNVYEALNGYFAPMYSWLLMPLLLTGLPPLIAIKLLTLFIGMFSIISSAILMNKLEIHKPIQNIILLTLAPVMVYFVYAYNTPDLLLVCVLLFYFLYLFKNSYSSKTSNGFITGVLGGIAYLSKYYAFPFFLVHFPVINILHYYRSKTKHEKHQVRKNFLVGLIAFSILSGVWILAISLKYNEFTITTSAKYVYYIMEPGTKGHPVGYQGFFNPTSKDSKSAWEDPSKLIQHSWNPLKSINDIKHQIKLSLEFTQRVIDSFLAFSFFSFAILFSYLLIYLTPLNKNSLKRMHWFPLISLMIYASGFILVLPVERYLWIDAILILFMGGMVLEELFKSDFFTPHRKKILLSFFVLSFWIHPFQQLALEQNAEKDVWELSQVLKNKYHISGNFASFSKYKKPLYLAFFMDSKFYGAAREGCTGEELVQDLIKNDIDYFFVWGRPGNNFSFIDEKYPQLYRFEEITKGEIPTLRIFKIKKE
ncbi:MAG: hypothetical protein D6748_01730 [Calditrichaeota bacterium]|nr:MAG: hypothetical protein D6748_01730 [Calditrichota bacterium]